MKLKTLIERRNELAWHSDIKRDRAIKVLKNFVQSNPGTAVDQVYKNIISTGQITKDDVNIALKIMHDLNWDQEDRHTLTMV